MSNRLIIIDSSYVCYVHRFALSAGLSYRGGRTEIIYGFLKSILDTAEHFKTKDFVFAWDSKNKHSLRRKIYPEYKLDRDKARGEMSEEDQEQERLAYIQFDQLRKDVLPNIGFQNIFRKKGYESDDIMASIITVESNDRKCTIVTGDEDLYQLLDMCSIYNMRKHEILTGKMFKRIYKIRPKEWVMVKALGGCTSDHVKGIPLIGEGRAIAFIRGELAGKMKERIDNDKGETVKQNLPLVKLPFKGTGIFKVKLDHLNIKDFKAVCKEYGLNSFLKPENLKKWKNSFEME